MQRTLNGKVLKHLEFQKGSHHHFMLAVRDRILLVFYLDHILLREKQDSPEREETEANLSQNELWLS